MKHSVAVTLILAFIFLLSQVVGLATVGRYIDVQVVNGTNVVEHPATVIGEAPQVENKSVSFLPLMLTILVGTAFIFVLMHFKLGSLWKYWFMFAVVLTMAISFGVYFKFPGGGFVAFILALALGAMKVFRPNVYVHNLTEVFIYTGITIAILPFLNLFSAFMLLILISIYDAFAVWKSKHMIKLAQFQTDTKVFAGLLIPYKAPALTSELRVKKPTRKKIPGKNGPKTAILGGGDIAFPMLFSAAVMEHLIQVQNFTVTSALAHVMIITAATTVALAGLLFYGKKDRFYPAMPFISLGCIIGFTIAMLI